MLISAGFDAHADDPLADCRVTDAGYAAMAAAMRRAGADVGAPVGVVLEGGYALDALARSTVTVLGVLAAAEAPPAPDLAVHPRSEAARARLAERWDLG